MLRAWQAFFENEPGPGGAGIQDRFVAMWRHVARRFARATAVAGFDILNEPNALSDEQQRRLSALYARVLEALRRGERDGRGRRHLVLFEPSVLWSATGHGAPPAFRHDRDVVYAPHIYTGGFDDGPITRAAFAVTRREAKLFGGAPVLAGEWGTDPARAGPRGDGYFLAHQRLQDAFRISATLWTWRESCGDPHKIADVRVGRTPVPWGEWNVDCATNTVRGPRAALVAELTRGYVRAAPGRLTAAAWDPAQTVLRASGRAPHRAGRLVAFYPGVPRIRTAGLGHIRTTKLPGGGQLVTATARGGAWRLRIGRR